MAFKMKGHTLPGINQRKEEKGMPWVQAAMGKEDTPGKYASPAKEVTHGSGQDWEHNHKERPAHSDTPEAHNKASVAKIYSKAKGKRTVY